MAVQRLYDEPFWAVALLFLLGGVAVALLSLLLAYRLTKRDTRHGHAELTNFTVTNIAVLYAVLLGFSAVAAWENFRKVSDTVSDEANLVGNLYHDTQGMPAALAADLRGHVVSYLHEVIDREWPMQERGERPDEVQAALTDLHRHVATLAPVDAAGAVLMADMLRVLNQIDAARALRLDNVGGQIPSIVWDVLILMGVLTIAYAAFVAAERLAMHVLMLSGLAAALTLVITLAIELDYPLRGSVSVSADPFRHVLDMVERPVPTADK